MLGTCESERLKVTALNLFHPTAFPPRPKVSFFVLRHSLGGEVVKMLLEAWYQKQRSQAFILDWFGDLCS